MLFLSLIKVYGSNAADIIVRFGKKINKNPLEENFNILVDKSRSCDRF